MGRRSQGTRGWKGVAAALDVVSAAWSSSRVQLYDRMLTPEFSRIVSESVKDADVTQKERRNGGGLGGLSLGLGN